MPERVTTALPDGLCYRSFACVDLTVAYVCKVRIACSLNENDMTVRLILLISLVAPCAEAAKPTYQVTVDGRKLQGTPLHKSSSELLLLARDGSYQHVKLTDAKSYRRLPGPFRSYSQTEVRGHLLREFGRQFDVSGTGNYLVVHPRGKRDQWAPRFEQLYRSCQTYFGSRGVQLKRLSFPLIAVVFPNRSDFLRFTYPWQSDG